MEQQTGSESGKEYFKAVILPCLFNLHVESHIMQNAGLYESQAGIKIARRNINSKLILNWHALSEHSTFDVYAYICLYMICMYIHLCI